MLNDLQLLDLRTPADAAQEMRKLGVDPKGIQLMQPKGVSYALKVKDIASAAANILKQEMLARGGEAALPWAALTQSTKRTDVLLFGTAQQYQLLVQKLKAQPFQLKELAEKIAGLIRNIEKPLGKLKLGTKMFDLRQRPLLMGVLNITPDSFSDGGSFFDRELAIAQAQRMLREGADIIDLGAESSRPGAREVPAKEELSRLLPVLKPLLKETKALFSIDTTKATVAEKCLSLGAHLINDISGLKADARMAGVVARYNVPIVLMHRSGRSAVMQKKTRYTDLIRDILASLQESIAIALQAGIPRGKLIIDPGIGFGKTTEQNLEIFKRLPEFKVLGLPILIGASRKSVIGNVLGTEPSDRLEGTLALSALALMNGASILRVHEVKENLRVLKMCRAVLKVKRT